METKNVNFLSIVLKNGLLLGLASVAFNVVLYVTDLLYTDSTLMGILTWLVATAISVVFIIMAIEQYKKANEGFLSIGEAISRGSSSCHSRSDRCYLSSDIYYYY